MVRRLTPDDRRAEIIARTHEMIATRGAEGLSLRKTARWCGMSAPGLLHHFSDLTALLEAVLTERAQQEACAYSRAIAEIDALGTRATLRDLADITVRITAEHGLESVNFDRLEMHALTDPAHPLHDYFAAGHSTRLLRPLILELVEREYENTTAVIAMLGLVTEGLRRRWLRTTGLPHFEADWHAVRDTVFQSLECFRKETVLAAA